MKNTTSKQSKVIVVKDRRNLLLLVLIGMLLSAILLELIYFLKFSFDVAMPIAVILGIFYILLIILLKPSKRIIRKTKVVKPAPQKLDEQDIKNAVKEAIEEEKEPVKSNITLHKAKYIASTEGSTFHKVSCRLGKLIKRKYKISNDSQAFFVRQKYKPCKLCMVDKTEKKKAKKKVAKKKTVKKTTKKTKKKK